MVIVNEAEGNPDSKPSRAYDLNYIIATSYLGACYVSLFKGKCAILDLELKFS